jgi:hypothetical protein
LAELGIHLVEGAVLELLPPTDGHQ